ncbi:MAG: aldehyde dehydrogenase [Methylacidiphilales bacterium]|nr:aldehyde dehydrogenase [Candidatus Methylacidiphilales bacterium]
MSILVTSYINGEWVKVKDDGFRIPFINPATEETLGHVQEADHNEVHQAVLAAQQTFARGDWSKNIELRKKALFQLATLVRKNQDLLAQKEVACTGIPISQVLSRHIPRAAQNFEFFAEFISQSSSPVFEQNPHYLTFVRHEPVGVAGLIAPWNAPLALASMKIAGAIAFGNSCVFKPSEFTPLSFTILLELTREAGIPHGVINMVNGRGAVTGNAIVSHPLIRSLCFTGGTATGKEISAIAGQTLKKAVYELGGKSANIICADADLDRALDGALLSIFSNNGQQCLAGSRILLEDSIYEDFTNRFIKRVSQLRIGDPLLPTTELGPIFSKEQFNKVSNYISIAKEAKDITILYGGESASGFKKGFYIQPTIISTHNTAHILCQEEIFGPFVALLRFSNIDEAISIANQSEFGLVCYIWSSQIKRIMQVLSQVQAGVIWVNTPLTRELRAPFGGYKNSGVGRDGGVWSRALFTEEKTITIPTTDFPMIKLGSITNE